MFEYEFVKLILVKIEFWSKVIYDLVFLFSKQVSSKTLWIFNINSGPRVSLSEWTKYVKYVIVIMLADVYKCNLGWLKFNSYTNTFFWSFFCSYLTYSCWNAKSCGSILPALGIRLMNFTPFPLGLLTQDLVLLCCGCRQQWEVGRLVM